MTNGSDEEVDDNYRQGYKTQQAHQGKASVAALRNVINTRYC